MMLPRTANSTWLILTLLTGCGRDLPQLSDPEVAAQLAELQPYDLSEYKVASRDFLPGPGGRWFTVRYLLRDGETASREDIRRRIVASLEASGWRPGTADTTRYVLTKVYETAADDLRYERSAQPGDRDNVFYNQYVHISDDASIIVGYYEIGW